MESSYSLWGDAYVLWTYTREEYEKVLREEGKIEDILNMQANGLTAKQISGFLRIPENKVENVLIK